MKTYVINTSDGVQHIINANNKQEATFILIERGTYILEEVTYVAEGSD